MRIKTSYLNFSRGSSIFSLITLFGAVLILSGCLSLPGGYRGHEDPTVGGRTPHRQYAGNVYYLDNTSLFRSENFSIRNERGQVIFRTRGNFFSRRMQVTLIGRSGNEIFTITKRKSGYKSRYRIYQHGHLAAKVYKKRTSRYKKFYVKSRRGRDYIIQGNFMNRLYAFYYRGRQVAAVTKRRGGFSDKYRIEISPGQNDLMILATTIIIDMENMYRRR